MSEINIIEIMEMIPHRYPLLLIDRVISIEKNKKASGIKNITFNEPQFQGHFPNNPVMPGVLIIEAMAQLSAVLVASSMEVKKEDKQIYFMAIDETKFRKVVTPGDSMHIDTEILQHRGDVWKFAAKALVDGKVVAESAFTAMVKNKE